MILLVALVALAGLLAVTLGVGLYLNWRQNRPLREITHEVVDPVRLGADALGESATLLQFSTERGVHCSRAHQRLASVAGSRTGVRHFDVDLTHRPDIARHFHILQTPTTLVLDRDGVVQTRFGGVPNRDVIELELTRLAGEATGA